MILKQSTSNTIQFLMVLTSDHISGATGKTVAVELGKAGNTGVAAANTPATEVDSGNLPGVYKITLNATDTNTLGSLAVYATAAGCDPTNLFFLVATQVFSDLLLDGSGRVAITSEVKQNTATTLLFIMTVNNTPTAGLAGFVSQRNFGSGWSTIAQSVTDLGNGWYKLPLIAADTNNNGPIAIHITAVNADDRNITLYTQP